MTPNPILFIFDPLSHFSPTMVFPNRNGLYSPPWMINLAESMGVPLLPFSALKGHVKFPECKLFDAVEKLTERALIIYYGCYDQQLNNIVTIQTPAGAIDVAQAFMTTIMSIATNDTIAYSARKHGDLYVALQVRGDNKLLHIVIIKIGKTYEILVYRPPLYAIPPQIRPQCPCPQPKARTVMHT